MLNHEVISNSEEYSELEAVLSKMDRPEKEQLLGALVELNNNMKMLTINWRRYENIIFEGQERR